ncbi:MAG: peptidylprolyl isomerase [Erysipelotrichaceae bacterium]|nr:peptidylprolyl isomerase [Erysipelotrichaceae bacterium]
MNDFLKKNWFVVLLVIAFTGISIFYIYDTNKGKLKGKTVNGEDVVYSITDKDVTASQFYNDLYTSNGQQAMIELFEKAVVEAGVPTTDSIKDTAKAQTEAIISNFQNQYGSAWETYLNSALKETGFDDLETYMIFQQKLNQVSADYAKDNFDDLKIRQISYILIQYENPDNPSKEPTADEQTRMKAVDDALVNGTSFADAAVQFSEDTSSSESGGVLGVIDRNSSSLDSAFLEASLALEEGAVSDWVRSDNFGYFRIMCTAATPETLAANNADNDPYLQLTSQYDTTLANKALWAKAQQVGFDFKGNTELEQQIKDALGVVEETPAETTEPAETTGNTEENN